MKTKNIYKIICFGLVMLISNISIAQHHQCEHAFHGEPDSVITIQHKFPFMKKSQDIQVAVYKGVMVFEGDIILGHVRDLNNKGLARDSNNWPDNTIPYVISSSIPAATVTLINDAVAHINSNTNLTLVVRTTQAQWVNIQSGTGCSVSAIGKPTSGNPNMTLSLNCSFGNIVHEFLHLAGMGHEQNREDRNSFVNINFSNIQSGFVSQFNQQINGFSDYFAYDFGSIMHYGAFFFAIDPTVPTITTIPPGQAIGQRTAMSATDIATINRLYPICASSTLTLSGELLGRYTSSTNIISTGTIDENQFGLLSAGSRITLQPGARIEVDDNTKSELVLKGCDP